LIGFFVLVASWGLPWHKLPSTISFSYIFDLLFALGVSFIFRLPWKFRWNINKQTFIAVLEVLAVASASIFAIWYMDIESPFRLVNGLEWHLLFFAPILEELVFRQTFQRLLIKQVGGKRVTSMLVASIFAFSHLFFRWNMCHSLVFKCSTPSSWDSFAARPYSDFIRSWHP
jgi:membrane protease YdiL (CAAX protease family)